MVNLAVDGYGVGQSYLRYQTMKHKVGHDAVLIMFVPTSNWWRDINTRRDLAGGWKLYQVMPRFIVEQNELKLIKSPFAMALIGQRSDADLIMQTLIAHLRQYDRFYYKSKFESPSLISRSIFYKLLSRSYYEFQIKELSRSFLIPGSESLIVSKKIFQSMYEEVKQDGNEFILVFLPGHRDLELIEQDIAYRENWDKMTLSFCEVKMKCVDLLKILGKLSTNQLDKGYDGTHYGPIGNQLIADLIKEHL